MARVNAAVALSWSPKFGSQLISAWRRGGTGSSGMSERGQWRGA